MKRWRSFVFALVTVFCLVAAGPAPSRGLEIYFIDVLGGAATLIVTPEGESLLVDCGWPGFEDRDAKRIEHVIKNVAKLDHLDYLMISHWHLDHYGGTEQLAKYVQIKHFLDRGLPDLNAADMDSAHFPDGPKANDRLGIAYRKLSDGKRTTLKAGDKLPLKGAHGLVLASGGEVVAAPRNAPKNPHSDSAPADLPEDKSDNARSLAFKLTFGAFDFFDAGDLTWNIEKKLVVPTDLIGPIDLYQVTHHGMDISNHPTLLKTVDPIVSIMNNGPRKGGAAATVERLRQLPSLKAAYQLHKNVATTAEQNTDPSLIANKDPKGGQFLRVSVPDGGKTFTVQFGVDGETRTFESR